ncbi:MAG TPA: hypothetical protein VF691_21980 [Cytophagaceae bacterium]|jgi:hypothetical protein
MKTSKFFIAPILLVIAAFCFFNFTSGQNATEYLQITAVESLSPTGAGQSRIISPTFFGQDEIRMENIFTSSRVDFRSIRSNDKLIMDRLTELSKDGWLLVQVMPGFHAGEKDKEIFITRYLFKR